MKHILIGYMRDGKGGIDHYIKNFVGDLIAGSDAVGIDIVSSFEINDLKDIFARCDCVSILRIHSLRNPVKQYRDFMRIFAKKHYDVAYFNISEATNGIGVKAAHDMKVPRVIVHSHSAGIDVESNITRNIRHLIHNISKKLFIEGCVDEFVACSDKAAQWMFSKDVWLNKKYTFIFNEVDISRYTFDAKLREEYRNNLKLQDKLVVGAVGGFSYQKNNLFFVDIVAELVKRCKNICFLAIGEGPLLERTKAYADKKGVSEKMIFMGQRGDIPALLMAMDVFVMPSRFEGLPFAAVEAQASGLRCLLSDNISKDTKLTDKCEFVEGFDGGAWAEKVVAGIDYARASGDALERIEEYYMNNLSFINSLV